MFAPAALPKEKREHYQLLCELLSATRLTGTYLRRCRRRNAGNGGPGESAPACVDARHVEVQRYPKVRIHAALFPAKGLRTLASFQVGDTIATFSAQDTRLRLLLTQHRHLPFPVATTRLAPYSCHCGQTHLRLEATSAIYDNSMILLREPEDWHGLLVQFDDKRLIVCTPYRVGSSYHCIVIQGDILPLINYLQHRGRLKRASIVTLMEQCYALLAAAQFVFRLVYLPRECNKLADYFAGQASATAQTAWKDPLAIPTYIPPVPYHLAQKLGFSLFSVQEGALPAFVLTKCPDLRTPLPPFVASQHPTHRVRIEDYIATAMHHQGTLTVGYKTALSGPHGRYCVVGYAGQRLPRPVPLALFGATHWEVTCQVPIMN